MRFFLSRNGIIGWIFLCSMALPGCRQKVIDPNDPHFVVAEPPRWKITRADLNRKVLSHMHGHHLPNNALEPERQARIEAVVLNGMVTRKLLIERAAQIPEAELQDEEARTLKQLRGQLTDVAYQQTLQAYGMTESQYKQSIHDDVAVRVLMEKEALHDTQPTDREVDDFYARNRALYTTPASVRFRRVFIAVKPEADSTEKASRRMLIDQARARVVKGEDFATVAREASDDHESAAKGGEIGWIFQGTGEPVFEQTAFGLPRGQTSAVIEISQGYEFIQVLESRPGTETPETEVRALIVDRLSMKKRVEQEQAYAQKLLADANVVYHVPANHPNER